MTTPRVYLDNCCYNRPYDDQRQLRVNLETRAKLYIQETIRKKEIQLISSFVLLTEVKRNNDAHKRENILAFIAQNVSAYVGFDCGADVEQRAEEIMRAGIHRMDALHIACAIQAQCTWFLTTDKKILRTLSKQIQIMNPLQWIAAWEENQ